MAKTGKSATRNRKYSIVELAIVLLIIAIFLSMAMPALNSLTQGRAVDTAARTIQSQLRQARMLAITTRQYVAILFPTADQVGWGADFPNSGFRSCFVVKNGSNWTQAPPPNGWISGSKWEFTPAGAVISTIEDLSTVTMTDDIYSGNCRAVIFKPTGGSYSTSVEIAEGMSEAKSNQNYIFIDINTNTGKANISGRRK